jgi:tetratricopeptide (TPR) repeat protein
LQNAAICYRELGEFDDAIGYFLQAVAAFEAAGMMSFRAKTRWTLARVLVQKQQLDDALLLLRELHIEFKELGMANDVAVVALDIAEILLAKGRHHEVADACRAAIQYFEQAQLSASSAARTAVSYLCEAAVSGRATAALVTDLRHSVISSAAPRAGEQRAFMSEPLSRFSG